MKRPSIFISSAGSALKALGAIPIYPLLLAIYPTIFLYGHNISELSIGAIWVSFLAAIALTCGAMLTLNVMIRNWHKTALITLLGLIVFYFYQPLVLLLPHHLVSIGSIEVTRGKFLLPAIGLFFLVASLVIIIKSGNVPSRVARPLNVMMALLLVISLVPIAQVESQRIMAGFESKDASKVDMTTTKVVDKPDVFFFIFDRYAGQNTLGDYYGFDNSPFLNHLEDRGFYIADHSYTNYPSTEISVAATLDMEYHQSNQEAGARQDLIKVVLPKVANAQAIQYFKEHGYKYYQVASHYNVTQFSNVADKVYIPRSQSRWHFDEFTIQVLQTTLLNVVGKHFLYDVVNLDKYQSFINAHNYQREVLPRIIRAEGPKVVFTHVLLPHDPYVMNKECQVLPQDQFTPGTNLPAYLDQLQCANKIATEWVDLIMKQSGGQAIIVLQADEGPYPLVNKMPQQKDFSNASVNAIKERAHILNTFYFPDQNYSQLHSSITPINTFRTILRQYFAADLPPLPDKVYTFPSERDLFDFIDTTDRLNLNATD